MILYIYSPPILFLLSLVPRARSGVGVLGSMPGRDESQAGLVDIMWVTLGRM